MSYAYCYSVKNVSTSDKAASLDSGDYHFNNGVDDFDMLCYSSAYTFDGSEDYAVFMSEIERAQQYYNSIYGKFDYATATAEEAGDAVHEFEEINRVRIREWLDKVFTGHLMKNIATWSGAQKTTYKTQLSPIYEASLTGDAGWSRELAAGITPAAPLTAAMITEFTDQVDLYDQKFPDGS